MGNGMSIKNIAQNYKGFKIEKVNTKGQVILSKILLIMFLIEIKKIIF